MQLRQLTAAALLIAAATLLWVAFSPPPAAPISSSQRDLADAPYAPRDWTVDGEMPDKHVSAFAFRDRNRNGEYDLGDLPMASVVIDLQRPDGTIRSQSTNINGYANFGMSHEDDSSDVSSVDVAHEFHVRMPPGFELTTDNKRQQTTFRHLPGASSNIIAENPPSVIGLAPVLSVTGRILPAPARAESIELRSVGPNGASLAIPVGADGHFRFAAGAGDWTLHISGHEQRHERRFSVADVPVVLSAIDLESKRLEPAPIEVTEDFEYLHRAVVDKIPNGHAGLNWNYLLAVDNQFSRVPGSVNTLMSGRTVAYNSSGHPATISAGPAGRFDFVGAYFGIAWPATEGEILHVEAWRDERLVGREALRLSYLGAVWFEADYRNIDRLELRTEHYSQFITDDMHFRLPMQ